VVHEVPAVFLQLNFLYPCTSTGIFPDHFVKDLHKMDGNTFTGCVFNKVKSKETLVSEFMDFVQQGIVTPENACVVKVFLDPFLEVTQASKIQHESILIVFTALKRELDGPIMSMDA